MCLHSPQGDYSVFLYPFKQDGRIEAVFEFVLSPQGNNASAEDITSMIELYVSWLQPAFRYVDLQEKMQKQKDLSAFLMNVVKFVHETSPSLSASLQ